MMKTVLVFDLDDTLYDELSYVNSGFRAVARFLADEFQVEYDAAYQVMNRRLAGGRGRIFDDLLSDFALYSRKNVRRCLSVYRLHKPSIVLYPEADACLTRFWDWPLYIVTDGNKLVQQNKIEALGLEKRVRRCFITHRFGVRNAKPSPYCFHKICETEHVEPQQVIYIADNPYKDFVGIKPLGFKTLRVLTGQHRAIEKPAEFEAEFRIPSLNELDRPLLETIFA
jgi:putative hydrolase of the HAD superfamily